jgi:deoxyribonuclease V
MTIAAFDVHYREDGMASAAAVCFQDFADGAYSKAYHHILPVPGSYLPGAFFRRELPCILELLARIEIPLTVLIIDGYVWLDGRPGLGQHLFEACAGRKAVIGVAKSPYHGAKGAAVHRGVSRKPLYVTTAGIDLESACRSVRRMQGAHRLPTLLRQVDRLARQGPVQAPVSDQG